MPISLSGRLQVQLRNSANHAIWKGAHQVYPYGLPNGEVPCLKNLVNEGVPRIQEAWEPLLRKVGIAAQLHGVVCHGYPVVRFGAHSGGCELGDFLLVHDHTHPGGVVERRAVLVQAKVFYQQGGVASKNPLQLELYKGWPKFTYTNWPGGLSSLRQTLNRQALTSVDPVISERDIALIGGAVPANVPTPTLEESGRYGLIDVDYHSIFLTHWDRNPWRLAKPNSLPSVYQTKSGFKLGTYLTRLIRGDTGRMAPVTDWPDALPATCHWSLVIRELMSLLPAAAVSGLAPAAHALSAAPAPQISTQHEEQEEQEEQEERDGGPDIPEWKREREPEKGGFAVILVSTSGSASG